MGGLFAGVGAGSGCGRFSAKEIEEGFVAGELLIPLIGNLGAGKHHEGEVLSIDITHLLEVIEKFPYVGFGAPHEGHPVAKHFLREDHLLLSNPNLTKVDIEVVLQSTLRKMPWRFLPQVEGVPSDIAGSVMARLDWEGGGTGCWR